MPDGASVHVGHSNGPLARCPEGCGILAEQPSDEDTWFYVCPVCSGAFSEEDIDRAGTWGQENEPGGEQ